MNDPKKLIIALAFMASASVVTHAQEFFIGPKVEYSISTGVPVEASAAGAPTRANLGIVAAIQTTTKLEFRFGGLYRIENAGLRTSYQSDALTSSSGRLNAIDPTPGGPQVVSDIETSSIELSGGLYIPMMDLDSAGASFGLNFMLFGDMMLGGTQVDDYSAVESLRDSTATFDLASQIGGGVGIGAGVVLPMGGTRLIFDLQLVFRQPSEFEIENSSPTQTVPLGWLVGKGLRIGLGFMF